MQNHSSVRPHQLNYVNRQVRALVRTLDFGVIRGCSSPNQCRFSGYIYLKTFYADFFNSWRFFRADQSQTFGSKVSGLQTISQSAGFAVIESFDSISSSAIAASTIASLCDFIGEIWNSVFWIESEKGLGGWICCRLSKGWTILWTDRARKPSQSWQQSTSSCVSWPGY